MTLHTFETPRESDLGLSRISSRSGLSISVLPNGCVFAIEHQHERGRTLINQTHGSPLDGGIGRLYLRLGVGKPVVVEVVGAGAKVGFGAADDCFTWEGASAGLRHSVSLWLHPRHNLWLWRVQVANAGAEPVTCDATLVQDVGLGARGFVMNNEAYVSQYIDHHVARHALCGPVVMCRQNCSRAPATLGSRMAASRVPPPSPPMRCSCLARRTGTQAGSTPSSICRASASSMRLPVR